MRRSLWLPRTGLLNREFELWPFSSAFSTPTCRQQIGAVSGTPGNKRAKPRTDWSFDAKNKPGYIDRMLVGRFQQNAGDSIDIALLLLAICRCFNWHADVLSICPALHASCQGSGVTRDEAGTQHCQRKAKARAIEKVKQLGLAEVAEGLFYKQTEGQKLVISVHSDDLLIMGSSKGLIEQTKTEFHSIATQEKHNGIQNLEHIEQAISLIDSSLLHKSNGESNALISKAQFYKSAQTGAQRRGGANEEDLVPLNGKSRRCFQAALPSLNYIANRARPETCFAIYQLSRNHQSPLKIHLKILRQVVSYLRVTSSHRSLVTSEPGLLGFTDASSGGGSAGHAQGGVIWFYGGNPVYWLSGKLLKKTRDIAEAELSALIEGIRVGSYLAHVATILGVLGRHPVAIKTDNESAFKTLTSRTKIRPAIKERHPKIEELREFIDSKIQVGHIKGKMNAADMLTRPLTPKRLQEARDLLKSCQNGTFPID